MGAIWAEPQVNAHANVRGGARCGAVCCCGTVVCCNAKACGRAAVSARMVQGNNGVHGEWLPAQRRSMSACEQVLRGYCGKGVGVQMRVQPNRRRWWWLRNGW